MTQRSKQQRLNCLRKKVLKFGYCCTGMTLTNTELMRFKYNNKYVGETFTGIMESLIKARKKKKKEIISLGFIDYLTLIPGPNNITPGLSDIYNKIRIMTTGKNIVIKTVKQHKPISNLHDHI